MHAGATSYKHNAGRWSWVPACHLRCSFGALTVSAPAKPWRSRVAGTTRGYSLSRSRQHHLGQKLLALLLGAVALHGRGKTLEDAVLESGDDGVVHVALAADRPRGGELVGGGANGVEHLALAAALARRRRNPRQRFQHHGGCHQGAEILQRNLDTGDLAQKPVHGRRGNRA